MESELFVKEWIPVISIEIFLIIVVSLEVLYSFE